MKPQDYKDKRVRHTLTDAFFTVAGGQKRGGTWFLKDNKGKLYPIEECQLAEIDQLEFDLRKLKAVKSPKELEKFFESRGRERFQQVWAELEKDSVEAAAVAIFYCNNWDDFSCMCNAYGVSRERLPELNHRFRDRLKEKGLDGLVKQWYQEYSNAKATTTQSV